MRSILSLLVWWNLQSADHFVLTHKHSFGKKLRPPLRLWGVLVTKINYFELVIKSEFITCLFLWEWRACEAGNKWALSHVGESKTLNLIYLDHVLRIRSQVIWFVLVRTKWVFDNLFRKRWGLGWNIYCIKMLWDFARWS